MRAHVINVICKIKREVHQIDWWTSFSMCRGRAMAIMGMHYIIAKSLQRC